MDRHRLIALTAVAVAVVAGVLLLLLSGGDDDKPAQRKALADPITFVPANADVLVDVDLAAPLPAIAFRQLLPANLRSELPARGRGALAVMSDGRRWLAFQGRDRVHTTGARFSTRATRAAFERRLAGLPRRAGVRLAFKPNTLLRRFAAGAGNTRWGRALRDGAAALVVRGNTILLPFRLNGAAPADALPFAPGRTAPQTRGRGELVAGVRDPARTLRFAREAGLFPELDVLDQLPSILRPDLERLGTSGTLASDARGGLTVRVEPDDPGDWSRTLNRFDALSGLARSLGIADVRIDRDGDAYRVEQDGRFALQIGVFGKALVLSNREGSDLRAAAAARPLPRPAGAAGGATLTLQPELFFRELERLTGGAIPRDLVVPSAVTGWVRAATTGAVGELRVSVP